MVKLKEIDSSWSQNWFLAATNRGAYCHSFPGGSDGKASVYNVGDVGSIPGQGSSLEKEMATHSSTLA